MMPSSAAVFLSKRDPGDVRASGLILEAGPWLDRDRIFANYRDGALFILAVGSASQPHSCSLIVAPAGDRRAPTIIDRHQPKEDTDSGAHQHRIRRLHTHDGPDRYDSSTGERRDGVEIASQNKRDVSGEDVSGHPAADTGQHAQDRSHQWIDAMIYRLLCADDRKQTKSNGVERLCCTDRPLGGGDWTVYQGTVPDPGQPPCHSKPTKTAVIISRSSATGGRIGLLMTLPCGSAGA